MNSNPSLHVLIVDDEPHARKRLQKLLQGRAGVTRLDQCGNGLSAVAIIREQSPDLVFLDIQMPDLDGFGVVSQIGPALMPGVIFVTAYDRYAIRAFDVNALDYLLKPFDDERFERAFAKFIQQREHQQMESVRGALGKLLADMEQRGINAAQTHRFAVHDRGRVYFVQSDKVDYITADGAYIRLHCGSRIHLVRESIKNLAGVLDPNLFLRIHRSVMINVGCVQEVYPGGRGDMEILMVGGVSLKCSRNYRDHVRRVLGV